MSLSRDLRSYKDLRLKLFEQGVINHAFLRLEGAQDSVDPRFVLDMINLFFTDAEQILREINKAMTMRQINLDLADRYVHQLKGCTSCLGVSRIKNLTEAFRTSYLEGSVDGCLRAVKQINQEYAFCKGRLQSLKNLAEQIWAAGGVLPGGGASL